MKCSYIIRDEEYFFRRLTVKYLEMAVTLCNGCVGENLYPMKYLAEIIDKPDHFFYLLFSKKEEVVGYIYFYLTDLEEMSRLSKLLIEQIACISQRSHPVIGNLQSIGVVKKYQRKGMSAILMDIYLSKLSEIPWADVAFGVFWKAKGFIPMEKTLNAFQFTYLTDAHGVWQDKKDLICPVCQGTCVCDAAIYYKTLEKGYTIEAVT